MPEGPQYSTTGGTREMPTVNKFEDLEIFQTARVLTRRIYTVTNDGAFAKDYGLRDQMRRAAVSIMSNIAEGFESRTNALFIEFLGRARASAGEFRAQAYVALDIGYIDQNRFEEMTSLAEKCGRQISSLIAYLKEHKLNPRNS